MSRGQLLSRLGVSVGSNVAKPGLVRHQLDSRATSCTRLIDDWTIEFNGVAELIARSGYDDAERVVVVRSRDLTGKCLA